MAVIQSTLELVCGRLNDAFTAADPREEAWVILSNLVDNTGQPSPGAQDKLVMCLTNIEHETIISTFGRSTPIESDRMAIKAPPLYINIYVLFYANFGEGNYNAGLGMISRTISFFQQNPWFTRDNLPGMDPILGKLQVEFCNLDLVSINHMMGILGVKYLPSVYYKLRVSPFRGDAMQSQVPVAQGMQSDGTPKPQPFSETAPTPSTANALDGALPTMSRRKKEKQ